MTDQSAVVISSNYLSDLRVPDKHGVPEYSAKLYRANADLTSAVGCAVCENDYARLYRTTHRNICSYKLSS